MFYILLRVGGYAHKTDIAGFKSAKKAEKVALEEYGWKVNKDIFIREFDKESDIQELYRIAHCVGYTTRRPKGGHVYQEREVYYSLIRIEEIDFMKNMWEKYHRQHENYFI